MIENDSAGSPGLALLADLAAGRSSVRRRILVLLLADARPRLHLREIQRRAGTSPGTAARELGRLVSAGLVERATEGRQVYFRATASTLGAPGRPVPEPSQPVAEAAVRDDARRPAARSSVAAGLVAAVRPLYDDRFRGAWLYDPSGNPEAPPGPAAEVLLLLDRVDSYGDELERTSRAVSGLAVESGVLVSRAFVAVSAWESAAAGPLARLRAAAAPLGRGAEGAGGRPAPAMAEPSGRAPDPERGGEGLARADRAIAAARRDVAAGDGVSAAERAWIAMLEIASACLAGDGLAPLDPTATCIAYGARFGRSGRLYSAYHRWLLDAFDLRKAAAAGLPGASDLPAAATVADRAELFRDATARLLARIG